MTSKVFEVPLQNPDGNSGILEVKIGNTRNSKYYYSMMQEPGFNKAFLDKRAENK